MFISTNRERIREQSLTKATTSCVEGPISSKGVGPEAVGCDALALFAFITPQTWASSLSHVSTPSYTQQNLFCRL